jgi:hypothetical protein
MPLRFMLSPAPQAQVVRLVNPSIELKKLKGMFFTVVDKMILPNLNYGGHP